MARNKTRHLEPRQKNLAKLFEVACYRNNRGMVWSDFMSMAAISISNTIDKVQAAEREKLYLQLAAKYNDKELEAMTRMFAEIVEGMEEDPDRDFLGELFMCLELSNAFAGQFFTPYSLCQMTARMNVGADDLMAEIERNGWISVLDPACGAGALLVAFANECRNQGINPQTSVLFAAQDIDPTVACMCYVQLSLLGCAGYVVVADTLRHPAVCLDDRGLIPAPGQTVWYTPMYFRDVWHWRRVAALMDLSVQRKGKC